MGDDKDNFVVFKAGHDPALGVVADTPFEFEVPEAALARSANAPPALPGAKSTEPPHAPGAPPTASSWNEVAQRVRVERRSPSAAPRSSSAPSTWHEVPQTRETLPMLSPAVVPVIDPSPPPAPSVARRARRAAGVVLVLGGLLGTTFLFTQYVSSRSSASHPKDTTGSGAVAAGASTSHSAHPNGSAPYTAPPAGQPGNGGAAPATIPQPGAGAPPVAAPTDAPPAPVAPVPTEAPPPPQLQPPVSFSGTLQPSPDCPGAVTITSWRCRYLITTTAPGLITLSLSPSSGDHHIIAISTASGTFLLLSPNQTGPLTISISEPAGTYGIGVINVDQKASGGEAFTLSATHY